MPSPLPDWDRICKKIVDGDVARDKCKSVLEGEFSGDDDEDSWFDRLMRGDPATLAVVALPIAALLWYVYFTEKNKNPAVQG